MSKPSAFDTYPKRVQRILNEGRGGRGDPSRSSNFWALVVSALALFSQGCRGCRWLSEILALEFGLRSERHSQQHLSHLNKFQDDDR